MKKRTVKEIKQICENHIDVAMGKEIDDEGGMAMSQLDAIEDAVNRLALVCDTLCLQDIPIRERLTVCVIPFLVH